MYTFIYAQFIYIYIYIYTYVPTSGNIPSYGDYPTIVRRNCKLDNPKMVRQDPDPWKILA